MVTEKREKILIADDSEMNRAILSDMLGGEYDIVEAEDGAQAVAELERNGGDISLVLLDIVMPNLDGFDVLKIMNDNNWIDDIPVIMISSETESRSITRAYEMGVTDFISRPFDISVVYKRVENTLLLYSRQKRLIGIAVEQIYEKDRQSSLMVDMLSHIVEYRNSESGMHVLHIRALTSVLLGALIQRTDRYKLTRNDLTTISMASAFHDIGKIAIPEHILNKPGKLTSEEFEVIKTHCMEGAGMLERLPMHKDEPLVKTAYEICRWHHERYDGRGYPDGLKGDEIPISAQIVSLADVYDSLTSKRVYKDAYSHEQAVSMIMRGECGAFNPLLLECFIDCADTLVTELRASENYLDTKITSTVEQEIARHGELAASQRTLQLLEHERMKYSFFASMSNEIQFEYLAVSDIVTMSAWGAERLGLSELIERPHADGRVLEVFGKKNLDTFTDELRSTTPEKPVVEFDCEINIGGEKRWTKLIGRATWSGDEPPRYLGAIGKATDIHDMHERMAELEWVASHDALTGLFNFGYTKKKIEERMAMRPGAKYALAIMDLDRFKQANDNYGHMFGNEVLVHIAEKLRKTIRTGDIAGRVGGDEFLIELEYTEDIEGVIDRIYRSLCGKYKDFDMSFSMGVAKSEDVGADYDSLFRAADTALYTLKNDVGRGGYIFYNDSMTGGLSQISQIDD